MPYASNKGTKIYFELEGSGPPLLLAHGVSGSLEDWREYRWVENLKERYQLVLVDARGHGQSDKPHEPEAYRMAHQAADHIAVLDEAGIERAHFLGFSMGGLVSLGAALHAPERCLSFLMGGTQPYSRADRQTREGLPTPKPLKAMPDVENPIDELLARGGKEWAAFYEANITVSDEMRKRLMANDFGAVRARFKAIYEKDISAYLGRAQMPGLMYVGEYESAYGGSKQLAEQLPDAKFIAFPELNHFHMLSEVEVILPEIMQFLEQFN